MIHNIFQRAGFYGLTHIFLIFLFKPKLNKELYLADYKDVSPS